MTAGCSFATSHPQLRQRSEPSEGTPQVCVVHALNALQAAYCNFFTSDSCKTAASSAQAGSGRQRQLSGHVLLLGKAQATDDARRDELVD